jgi:hypothetical protein
MDLKSICCIYLKILIKWRDFMKKNLLIIIVVIILVTILPTSTFAYGTLIYDLQSSWKTWLVVDPIPMWIGTTCTSNLFQNYKIAGQYIGFHECSTFANQIEWDYGYYQTTSAGPTRYYYKGDTLIGSTNMPYDGNVLYSIDWIWDNHSGNTSGNVIGSGYSTYYAKSTSSFFCMEALWGENSISNSVSMTVS